MPDTVSDHAVPRVGLFVTCLVDAMRPWVGFAAIQVPEEAGCAVEMPEAQTCCGQPAFNNATRVPLKMKLRSNFYCTRSEWNEAPKKTIARVA